jgi:protein-tyrosine phosphatase
MKYFFVFNLAGFLALCWGANVGAVPSMIVLVNIAIAFFGVGLAFGLKKPRVLLKAKNGRLSLFSYIFFWPYLLLNNLSLGVYRLISRENPIDEIIPNLYLGYKPWRIDKEKFIQKGIRSVVDLTSEFGEAGFILKNFNYLSVPLLDARPPTQDQLRNTVAWIDEQLKNGGVFVHCALGHGRSATIIGAYLLNAKITSKVQYAVDFIKSKRPKINLHRGQFLVLQQYMKANLPSMSSESEDKQ